MPRFLVAAPSRSRPLLHTRRTLLRPLSRAARLLLFASLLAAHGLVVSAQDEPDLTEDVVRVRTDLVTIPAIVTDGRGRRVANLKREDFAVTDESRPARVDYFATGTERVALAFLLDASGSVRDNLARQREAARALLSRFGQKSRVSVWRFAEQAELAVPFTSDAEIVGASFDFPAAQTRRTAIFDAAAQVVRSFAAGGGDAAERRIIILISDGLDTGSTTTARNVVDYARAAGVSIYAIHLPLYAPRDGRLAARPAAKGFRALAEESGGRYFVVGDARAALDPRATADLAPVFRAVEEDLASQYVLGFYPAAETRGNTFRRVQVNLNPQGGRKLRVRQLREGYALRSQESGPRAARPDE